MPVALVADVQSHPIIEWTVSRGDAEVVCTLCDTDRGVELSVTFAGLRTAHYVARTVDEAHDRGERIRQAWEAVGYGAA
jgi:hypothetical protein